MQQGIWRGVLGTGKLLLSVASLVELCALVEIDYLNSVCLDTFMGARSGAVGSVPVLRVLFLREPLEPFIDLTLPALICP